MRVRKIDPLAYKFCLDNVYSVAGRRIFVWSCNDVVAIRLAGDLRPDDLASFQSVSPRSDTATTRRRSLASSLDAASISLIACRVDLP